MTTATKTFGKAAKKQVKEIFPTAAKAKSYGNKMNQFINFYDSNNVHLGYWTNERRDKGVFRVF